MRHRLDSEHGPRAFPATRWTLIRSAQLGEEERRRALDELLCSYWKPLYFYALSRGLPPQQAQDAVQSFCLQLIEKERFLERLDPERGKLRSFLKSALRNHLINQHERASAEKRGGGYRIVSLDMTGTEHAVSPGRDPDHEFEVQWASTVLQRALSILKQEFAQGERSGSFELLEGFFSTEEPPSYRELAERHAMTIPQLKSFLHRARGRLRELVRQEVAATLDSPDQAGSELADLLRALHS